MITEQEVINIRQDKNVKTPSVYSRTTKGVFSELRSIVTLKYHSRVDYICWKFDLVPVELLGIDISSWTAETTDEILYRDLIIILNRRQDFLVNTYEIRKRNPGSIPTFLSKKNEYEIYRNFPKSQYEKCNFSPKILIPVKTSAMTKKKEFNINLCINKNTKFNYMKVPFVDTKLGDLIDKGKDVITTINYLLEVYNGHVGGESEVSCLLDIPINLIAHPLFSFNCDINPCFRCRSKRGITNKNPFVTFEKALISDEVKSTPKGYVCTLDAIRQKRGDYKKAAVLVDSSEKILWHAHNQPIKSNHDVELLRTPYAEGMMEIFSEDGMYASARYEVLMRMAILLEKVAATISSASTSRGSVGQSSFYFKDIVSKGTGYKSYKVINWGPFVSKFPFGGLTYHDYMMIMHYHPYFVKPEKISNTRKVKAIFTKDEVENLCSCIEASVSIIKTKKEVYDLDDDKKIKFVDGEIATVTKYSYRQGRAVRGHFCKSKQVEMNFYGDVYGFREYLLEGYSEIMSEKKYNRVDPIKKLPDFCFNALARLGGEKYRITSYASKSITPMDNLVDLAIDEVERNLIDFINFKMELIPDIKDFLSKISHEYKDDVSIKVKMDLLKFSRISYKSKIVLATYFYFGRSLTYDECLDYIPDSNKPGCRNKRTCIDAVTSDPDCHEQKGCVNNESCIFNKSIENFHELVVPEPYLGVPTPQENGALPADFMMEKEVSKYRNLTNIPLVETNDFMEYVLGMARKDAENYDEAYDRVKHEKRYEDYVKSIDTYREKLDVVRGHRMENQRDLNPSLSEVDKEEKVVFGEMRKYGEKVKGEFGVYTEIESLVRDCINASRKHLTTLLTAEFKKV